MFSLTLDLWVLVPLILTIGILLLASHELGESRETVIFQYTLAILTFCWLYVLAGHYGGWWLLFSAISIVVILGGFALAARHNKKIGDPMTRGDYQLLIGVIALIVVPTTWGYFVK